MFLSPAKLLPLTCWLLCSAAGPALEYTPVATLTGAPTVQDGDGLLFGKMEIRLRGIAAPELDDPMGWESKNGLKRLVNGKDVTCYLDGTLAGSSRRPVGICFVGELDLGEFMVGAGLARDCLRYSEGRYREVEQNALDRGLKISEIYSLPSYCR